MSKYITGVAIYLTKVLNKWMRFQHLMNMRDGYENEFDLTVDKRLAKLAELDEQIRAIYTEQEKETND
jgi:hypothetical protein